MKTVVALAVALSFSCAAATYAQLGDELSRRQALERYRAGQELLTAERYEQAGAEFTAAIKLDPLLTLAHYGLGQSYMGLKRYASAIQAFNAGKLAYATLANMRQTNAFEVDRRMDDEIRELRESINAARTGKIKGAGENSVIVNQLEKRLDDLERTRQNRLRGEQYQAPAELSLALGSAYYRNSQMQDAEREWLLAVKVNSKLGQAHNNLAALYLVTGRRIEAETAVKNAERTGFRVNPKLKEDIKAMK
jgi:tetratricopeptide (TPR) repeat protein